MKLISLNTWGGRCFEHLIKFIKDYKDTDIFCFQEVQNSTDVKKHRSYRANLLSEIKNLLPDFQVVYFPVVSNFDFEANLVDFNLDFGQAMFITNSIKIISHQDYFISGDFTDGNPSILNKDFSNLPTPLQCVEISVAGKIYSIFNFHGSPMPGNKLDTSKRLAEAQKTTEIIDSKNGLKVLVGDFNLLPQTQSIKIFESNLRNLIKEFNIEKTRSSLSPFFGTSDFQKFADYTFVSAKIKVLDFKVPDINISDHLPMILQFT